MRHKQWQARCRQHADCVEPQWTIGTSARPGDVLDLLQDSSARTGGISSARTGDERFHWWRTYDMMADIAPPGYWAHLNQQEKLHLAVAVNQMDAGMKVRMPFVSDEDRDTLLEDGRSIYWHGTYPSCLYGINRHGLCPTSGGAGADERGKKYGENNKDQPERAEESPQVYVARERVCAKDYPILMWEGETILGEVVATDGTKPLRALIECAAFATERTWKRLAGNRTQYSYAYGTVKILSVELHACAVCPEGQSQRCAGLQTMKQLYMDPNGPNVITGLYKKRPYSARTGGDGSSAGSSAQN